MIHPSFPGSPLARSLGCGLRPLALAALLLAPTGALAAERLSLRTEVSVRQDVLTLFDLVEGATGPIAEKPLFRSPALGETGTIQARRIQEAAAELGLGTVETAGRSQVIVARAARRVEAAEIEAALKQALELQHGVDARALSLVFDGTAPSLVTAPDATGAAVADELSYDRRSRRVSAAISVRGAGNERRPLRVAGTAVEFVDVAVLTRSLNRGEAVGSADITHERRAKENVAADAQLEAHTLQGRVARRALAAGSVVRSGDLARPEIVARGEAVTIVYESPGLTLTLRGRANEAGAQGDLIAVTNPQSKKALQATVVAPGRVSVGAALPGRVAVHAAPARP